MSRHDLTLSPAQQADKRAARDLIEAIGGPEAAEPHCRVSVTMLRSYGNRNTPDFMPIDVARELQSISHGRPGHPAVTRRLARCDGFALVAKPDAEHHSDDWLEHLAELADEPAAITRRICKALSDTKTPHRLTPQESRAAGLRDLVHEAMTELAGLDAALERLEGEG